MQEFCKEFWQDPLNLSRNAFSWVLEHFREYLRYDVRVAQSQSWSKVFLVRLNLYLAKSSITISVFPLAKARSKALSLCFVTASTLAPELINAGTTEEAQDLM